jgi:hypothetical protein
MKEEPQIIELRLRFENRPQAIDEAARGLRKEMELRKAANPSLRYSPKLNYYHLENRNLQLKYELIESSPNVILRDSEL